MDMKAKGLVSPRFALKTIAACAFVGFLCLGTGNLSRAQTTSTLSPDLQEVVKLSKQHMSDDVIINYIKSSGRSYKLSVDDIINLNNQGVSSAVISALQTASSGAGTSATTPPPVATTPPATGGASMPEPPALDAAGGAPPPVASTPPAAVMPPPGAAPAALRDNFFEDGGLNPALWTTQSSILSSLGAMEGVERTPALVFTPSGMQMSGIRNEREFMGIQSVASFVPPFTFSANVSGMDQRGIPFEVYLVSADLQQWLSVAGHLGGRGDREEVRIRGPLGGLAFPTGSRSTPEYGIWLNHSGSGWPISALGERLFDRPIANEPYTIQISASADGRASVSLLTASGQLVGAQNVFMGNGPFSIVLAGRDGSTRANWQSAQLTSPVAPAAVEQAPPPPATPTMDYFKAQLAPYGNWVQVPGYGLCWQPVVDPGWRPYYDGGHWEYTDAGWYWQSDYPWGDIGFHYGRWVYAEMGDDPSWVWMPGYDYAPAWVVWRHADDEGYIGWAPLPPGAVFVDGGWEYNHVRVGADFAFGMGPGFFTFVDYGHLFFDPHLYPRGYRAFVVPQDRLAFIFGHSVVMNHYRFDHGRFFDDGLPHDRMVALTHHDIRVMTVHDLRHDEEMRDAMVRRDDIRDFHPGMHPSAIRAAEVRHDERVDHAVDQHRDDANQRDRQSPDRNSQGNDSRKDNNNNNNGH
jgi:hypothetical protein